MMILLNAFMSGMCFASTPVALHHRNKGWAVTLLIVGILNGVMALAART